MFHLPKYILRINTLNTLCLPVRNLRRSAKSIPISRPSLDPGVHKRAKLLDKKIEDVEELEDVETDFMDVGTSYKEHMREMAEYKEKLKYKIVRQKYFKLEKLPNFLTWSDKLQIKYLHNKDPEEWSVEKLSEGFPALPEFIDKVIKSSYNKTDQKIARHDESVKKNWNEFTDGKLDLPEHLKQHLKKFTSRATDPATYKIPDYLKENQNPTAHRVEGEFSAIITSYEKLKNKNMQNKKVIETKTAASPYEDTYRLDNKKPTTANSIPLSRLKKDIQSKVSHGEKLSEDDLIILAETQKRKNEIQHVEKPENSIIELNKSLLAKENKQVTIVKQGKDYSHLHYPEKIAIPKDKMKRGYTYKLNDCYYDSDGWFLYRVPGMT